MKRILTVVTLASTLLATACGTAKEAPKEVPKEATSTPAASSAPSTQPAPLKGEIVFWHSFTQGPRADFMKQAAEDFMKKNPDVKIKIETFSWGEFYTKWTTGLLSGQVPDVSTALPNHVVEMLNADAIIPIDDVIDKIGRTRFYEAPLNEGFKDGKHYSIPIYSHAQVMWYRKDLLKAANLEVPKTWSELFDAAKKVNNPPNVYGLSVPMGSGDLMATRFLNFYVRSAGDTLVTKDGKANLTSKAALDGIKYWVNMYRATSPSGSVNFKVLDQATLFYQGKTAFDFNSGFQIGGVQANSPALVDQIDAAPIPKINANDPDRGIETSNIPIVIWKNSKHPEIAKAFVESLYEKEKYIKFLHSVPAGMLPAMKDIAEDPEFLNDPIIKQFSNAVKIIGNAVDKGTAIGMEYGPTIQSGIITSQNVIEMMFQDIIAKKDQANIEEEAKKAEKKLNDLFAAAQK